MNDEGKQQESGAGAPAATVPAHGVPGPRARALRPLADSRITDDVVWSLLEAVPDGIVICDRTGKITLVNRRLEELFGFPREELLGQPVEVLLPNALRDAHVAHRDRYAVHPRVRNMGEGMVLVAAHRDGHEFPVEVSLSPITFGDGTSVIASVRDVTERKAREAELQAAQESLAVVGDRERIARDLHDTVIQRVFAAGLALQGVASATRGTPAGERVVGIVDELDEVIREIRTAIFALSTPAIAAEAGVRSGVMKVVAEVSRILRTTPSVRLDGPIDTGVTPEQAQHVVAVLREMLTNVARHADAGAVAVELSVDDFVTLRVTDDGRGLDVDRQTSAGNGLRNLAQRAHGLGGAFTLTSRVGGGTIAEWRVPLQA